MSETLTRLECPYVAGLTSGERELLSRCFDVWTWRRGSNALRLDYYKGKVRPRPMGIAISPEMDRAVQGVSGWGKKAVDALSALSRFDGYVFDGEPADDLSEAVRESDMVNAYNAACTSELLFGCAFLSVTSGKRERGEPEVMISTHSALHASGVWSNRLKRLAGGLAVVDADDRGNPTAMNLFTDDAVVELFKGADGRWRADRRPHSMGRCLMEVLRYRPVSDINPMGQSRITRAAMNIIDRAQEQIRLTAIAAEFNALAQKYLLGVDEDFFKDNSRWEAYYGSILAITANENGDVPVFGQLPQGSMQPHIDTMRQYACEFSGETAVPVSSLGVIHDNPSSAEAILCAKDDLITEAKLLNDGNTLPMRNVGLLALATLFGIPFAEMATSGDAEATCMPHFRDPMNYSPAITADFAVKYASVNAAYGGTRVCKERLGFTNEEIMRMDSDEARMQSRDAVDRLMEEAMGVGSIDRPQQRDAGGLLEGQGIAPGVD